MEPTNQTKLSAGYFFLSLGVIVTLITSVVSFLNLAFEVLNKRFPDALNGVYQFGYSSYSYDSARAALATLIIFFPVYLVVSCYWTKASRKELGNIDRAIRRWMTYIIIFLSGVVVAVDLVQLVRYFVSGEVTTRFILKVAVTLVVALYVGVYYVFDLKGKEKVFGFKMKLWATIKSSILVLALIIWSFTVIGSPSQQRNWRLDERRLQDLQNIQWQIISYWQQKEKLPEKITDLSNPLSGSSLPVDPEIEKGMMYEYRTTGPLSFELCATFAAAIPKGWVEYGKGGGIIPYPAIMEGRDVAVSSNYPYPGGTGDSWDHQAGHTCFSRTIDKDLYPPFPKPMSQ